VNQYEHFIPLLTTIYILSLYQQCSTIYHQCIIYDCIQYIYHKHVIIKQHHINITSRTQYTSIYVETQMGENHIMLSYIYQEFIHRKHQLPNSPAATGRRLQPPIYRLQPEGSYNSLNSLAPTRRRLQPPGFSGSNQKVATTT
jgi:hypothetical protein